MCLSNPKPSDQIVSAAPPVAPPPPTKTATKVDNKVLRSRNKSRRRGTSALTIRRTASVNTGSSGSGANINY